MPDKGKNYTVYVDSGSGAKKTDCQSNGSYLCFTMDGSGTVTIVSASQLSWWIWAAGGGAVAAAAVVVLLVRRKKRTTAETK